MYIEMKKYVHLISYKYSKNIVKNFKFKNKNVKKRRIENVWSAKEKVTALFNFILLKFQNGC